MKRVFLILLLMAMALPVFAACQSDPKDPSTEPTIPTSDPTDPLTEPTDPLTEPTVPTGDIPGRTGIAGISFTSDVTSLAGNWSIVKVYTNGSVFDAVSNAITLEITLGLDPYELVDGEAYIHNKVYNVTGIMSFGIEEINTALGVDDVDNYRGTAMWDSFSMGEVVADGDFYEQPGPAIITFRDIDDYGLYLNLVAGITAEIDTTNKNLIIAMNSDGQLLIGYSAVHLERPSVEGDWEYCLIFDKE